MTEKWENDNCAALKAHFAVYSIPQAAALWCGVPEKDVAKIIDEAKQIKDTGIGRSIWRHTDVSCLEYRSRAIAEAIEDGSLPHGREDALPVDEHVKHERRHFFGRDLKKWMEAKFPNEKPAFLFDDIERNSHTAISVDAYRALIAERDKLTSRLERAKEEYLKLRAEKEAIEKLNQSLHESLEKSNTPSERAETSYRNIIGALVDLMLSNSPGGQKHSIFNNQSAIIASLLNYHGGKPGIAQRTLEDKFAQAKKSLNNS